MLKLRTVSDRSGEALEPTLPITWCLCRDDVARLKKRGVKNPYLFLSIYHVDSKTEVARRLVPLRQTMEYIGFRRPGKHIINAAIVWPINTNYEAMRHGLLRRLNGGRFFYNMYERSYDKDGKNFSIDFVPKILGWSETYAEYLDDCVGKIEVNIGKEFFAPEPAAWEKKWVNFVFDLFMAPEADQCAFRRRRIFAYSLQPVVLLVWIVLITLARFLFYAFAVLVGQRDLEFKRFLRPFGNVDDLLCRDRVFWDRDRNFFFTNNQGEERKWWFKFLHPICLIWIGLGIYYHSFLIENKTFFIGAFCGWLALIIVTRVVNNWINKRLDKKLKNQEEKIAKAYDSLDPIICRNDNPLFPDIAALPSSHQTIYLRFKNLKAKICRPYAK